MIRRIVFQVIILCVVRAKLGKRFFKEQRLGSKRLQFCAGLECKVGFVRIVDVEIEDVRITGEADFEFRIIADSTAIILTALSRNICPAAVIHFILIRSESGIFIRNIE